MLFESNTFAPLNHLCYLTYYKDNRKDNNRIIGIIGTDTYLSAFFLSLFLGRLSIIILKATTI